MAIAYNSLPQLTKDLSLPEHKIAAVLKLFEEGNTIPFIARYRKEAIGNLDEVAVRNIQERFDYLNELEDRRQSILSSIESQGKLTEELKKKILAASVKSELEDIYLPYKPKRRTKAMIAKEKGLEPLAQLIFDQPDSGSPFEDAKEYVSEEKGVKDVDDALQGARHIVAEVVAENAEVRSFVRDCIYNEGVIVSKVRLDFEGKPSKFEQYYSFSELLKTIPSHRFLAIRRGEKEKVLGMSIEVEEEPLVEFINGKTGYRKSSPYGNELLASVKDAYKRLIAPSLKVDVTVDLKMKSDTDAVDIFAKNLNEILLAAPLGGKKVIGIDPGLRSGCKCAVVSETGMFIETLTLFLTQGERQKVTAKKDLLSLVKKHSPEAIAIGNGTASRETEAFVKETLKEAGYSEIIVVQVSESGASVYSASEVAREEFADLDLTIRGAISIGRRLQDPLAELVKVEPKALGVGQYQHDVYQPLLDKKLHDVVESCVNGVGVDANTSSASLLSYVAGIGPSLAKKIVSYRDAHGSFSTRKSLMKVSGMGERSFEQAAGFLRIRDGENPLDASAVHPERYDLVTMMAKDQGVTVDALVGKSASIAKIDTVRYLSDEVGKETLDDIVEELAKPGRDPRSSFEMPAFRDDVNSISDLIKGMVLEGIVTNVTAFGAFVDVGVHQDGLVHISQLANSFVKDPHDVVKAGDKLKVEVTDINIPLKRIALSTRIGSSKGVAQKQQKKSPSRSPARKEKKFSSNPFADL